MLPLAGSDPALAGYNEWLNEVSVMHVDSKAWDGTVCWRNVNWKHWFHTGLSPRDALIQASTQQTISDAENFLTEARVRKEKVRKASGVSLY